MKTIKLFVIVAAFSSLATLALAGPPEGKDPVCKNEKTIREACAKEHPVHEFLGNIAREACFREKAINCVQSGGKSSL